MDTVVIKVENLAKKYRLGTISHGMLYRDLQSWWARMRGTEDPNSTVTYGANAGAGKNEDFWALDDISFEAKQGEAIGIIGRNGAGKSTLLKILSRVTSPTRGEVKIKGRVASLLEVGTGFHPELTGRENIFLNGTILGMSKAEINRKFDEIVDFAEVSKFIDTPVKRYSSGMYVRLAFAVAAHLEPEILIIDEVLAVGDAQFQKKCLGKMGSVGKEGRTVLFVSHNMVAVQSLCQSAILLHNGHLIKQGASHDIVSYYLSNIGEFRASCKELAQDPEKRVQIRKIDVLDSSGCSTDTVDLNKSMFIEVAYDIKEQLTGLCIGLQVLSEENGQCLISLSDPELEISRLDTREEGYYQARIEIPNNILNTGSYQLRVGATSQRQIYDVVEDVYFNVVDNIGIVQMLGYERKNSMLSMQLPWHVVQSPLPDEPREMKC